MVSHDIILTEEMIFDFFNNTKLDHLDLSRNNFICSEQVDHPGKLSALDIRLEMNKCGDQFLTHSFYVSLVPQVGRFFLMANGSHNLTIQDYKYF